MIWAVVPSSKSKRFHLSAEPPDGTDGWATALCGWTGATAADYSAESVEALDEDLPWDLCRFCADEHAHRQALARENVPASLRWHVPPS